MNPTPTLVDTWLRRLKTHRWVAIGILVGISIVAITQFGQAMQFWIELFRPEPGLELVDVTVIDDPDSIRSFRSTWLNHPAYRLSESELRNKWVAARDKEMERFLREIAKKFNNDPVVIERWRRNWQESTPRQLTFQLLEAGFSIVDVKIRSTSSNTAVLSRLDLVVRPVSYSSVGLACAPQPITPSWEYNVLIEDSTRTSLYSLKLSHAVPPHGADRFLLTIGHGPRPALATYELRARLRYNDRSFLQLPPVQVGVSGPFCNFPIPVDKVRWIQPQIP